MSDTLLPVNGSAFPPADGTPVRLEAVKGLQRHPLVAEIERLRGELRAAQNLIGHLEVALQTNRRIGAAVGVLMAQRRISHEAAFDLLRAASQRRHCKLAEVAEEVLYTGALDAPPDTGRAPSPPARGGTSITPRRRVGRSPVSEPAPTDPVRPTAVPPPAVLR